MKFRREEGSVTVEAALVAPALLVLMLLVVYAGRAASTDADIASAAARAARAASQAADPAGADAAARQTATANLATAGIGCTSVRVATDTGRMEPGGSVTVTVGCQVSNGDLALLAVPGARWSTATSTQPVDTYRGFARGFGMSEGSLGGNPRVGGG
jgi:Flp pilus assembly protein TadG